MSKWTNKRWITLGDSITLENKYQPLMDAKIRFLEIHNLGQSGKSMTGDEVGSTTVIGKLQDYTTKDIVTIFAGTNDFKLNKRLGTLGLIGDTAFNTQTFYGAYRSLIEYILKQYPRIKIYLWTPLQRDNSGYDVNYTNSVGHKLIDYVNAVKEVGRMYGLPVLDLYSISGFTKLTLSALTRDGLHPTSSGYSRIADVATDFINYH